MEGRTVGFSVLVAEDDPRLRAMLRRTLRQAGWQVRVAEDGEQAMALIDAAVPDLLLTDIDMPRMGGVELVSRVRARLPELPVVFMSGNPEVDTLDLTPHFLSKPFAPESLDAVLARATAAAAVRRREAG